MSSSGQNAPHVAARVAALAASPGPLMASERAKVRVVVTDAVVQALILEEAGRAGPGGDLDLDLDEVPTVRTMRRFAEVAPGGAASVIGGTRRVSAEDAALVNATLIHARLTDDAHPAMAQLM